MSTKTAFFVLNGQITWDTSQTISNHEYLTFDGNEVCAVTTDGQLHVEQAPTTSYHVMRLTDMSAYETKTELTSTLANYVLTSTLTSTLSGYVKKNTAIDLGSIV